MPTPALHASIRLIDEALRDRPANSAVTIHTCSGNFQSTWMACGGHEPVAGAQIDAPDLDGHLLEYDTERASSGDPVRVFARGWTQGRGKVFTVPGTTQSSTVTPCLPKK